MHRDYNFELRQFVLPFMQLPKLRSFIVHTPQRWYGGPSNAFPINFDNLRQVSSITTLELDKADLPAFDIIGILAIPKALKSLRWIQ